MRGDVFRFLSEPVITHCVLNAGANVTVAILALRFSGRPDQKLGQLINLTFAIHGLVALFTILSRAYYSVLIVSLAPAVSMIFAAILHFTTIKSTPKVGVIGPWDPVLDRLDQPISVIDSTSIINSDYDVILLTMNERMSPDWSRALCRAMLAGTRVRHVADYLEETCGCVSIEHFETDDLPDWGALSYRPVKRCFDLLLVSAMAPLAVAICLPAMFAIRITMGAPIIYRQVRIGRGGQSFTMYKLRTMSAHSQSAAPQATMRDDLRITPIGRFIRRFRIDELPQLLNVVRGDMSVVGPRPEQPVLVQQYVRDMPAFSYRHLVVPGITGWAQVRAGYAADLSETRTKLEFDLFYIKNLSFALDLQILLRTFVTLATGGGAR